MSAATLLKKLRAEGISVSLNLKVEATSAPSDEALNLIKDNRDALLNHLAGQAAPGLVLHGDILLNLLRWLHKFYELRLEHPDGLTLNATPEIALKLLERHEWAVLYDAERFVLLTNGDVPMSALIGKRDLTNDAALVAESEAA